MVTFGQLWDKVSQYQLQREVTGDEDKDALQSRNHPLLDSGEETSSMQMVRTGMNLRSKECGDFWEDFINLCNNNADAMSDLLDTPSEKVSTWPQKIRDTIEKVEKADGEEEGKEGKAELVPTGNEPVVSQDAGETAPADTKPLT